MGVFRNEAYNEKDRQELAKKVVKQMYEMRFPFRVDVYPLEIEEKLAADIEFEDTELVNDQSPVNAVEDLLITRNDRGGDPYHDQDQANEDDAFRHVQQVTQFGI